MPLDEVLFKSVSAELERHSSPLEYSISKDYMLESFVDLADEMKSAAMRSTSLSLFNCS